MKTRNTKECQGFETNSYEFVFAFLLVVFVVTIFLLVRFIQLQHDKITWLTSNAVVEKTSYLGIVDSGKFLGRQKRGSKGKGEEKEKGKKKRKEGKEEENKKGRRGKGKRKTTENEIELDSNPKKAEEKSTSSNPPTSACEPPKAGKAPVPAEGGLLYLVFLECHPETAALYQATKLPDSEPQVESDSKKASESRIEAESFPTPPPSSPQAEESPGKTTQDAVPTQLAPTTTANADTDTTPSDFEGAVPFLNVNGGPTGSYNRDHLGYQLGSSRPCENSAMQPSSD